MNKVIKNNKFSHAILLEVDDYDKYIHFVKKIIKMILCKENNKSFSTMNCGKCNICSLVDSDNYPDIKYISSDGSWIKKQQLIDLKNEFMNKSLLGNKKIYVIKEAEKLNPSSSNSLLKFLEEPEDDIIAILLTSNRYLLLDTIISRCEIFSFKNSAYDVDAEVSDKVEEFIDCLSKKQNLFINYKYLLENVFIDKNITKKILSETEKSFLVFLLNDKNLKEDELYSKMNKMSIDEIISYVKIIESEKQKLEYNINYKIWLDSFFSHIIGDVYD